jgi:hypothetical protein
VAGGAFSSADLVRWGEKGIFLQMEGLTAAGAEPKTVTIALGATVFF